MSEKYDKLFYVRLEVRNRRNSVMVLPRTLAGNKMSKFRIFPISLDLCAAFKMSNRSGLKNSECLLRISKWVYVYERKARQIKVTKFYTCSAVAAVDEK